MAQEHMYMYGRQEIVIAYKLAMACAGIHLSIVYPLISVGNSPVVAIKAPFRYCVVWAWLVRLGGGMVVPSGTSIPSDSGSAPPRVLGRA